MTTIDELIARAKKIIREEKEVMKILYQLAYVYTNNSPRKEEALRIMEEMAARGLITPLQIKKAIEDVKRWRKYRYRLSRELEFIVDNNGGDNKK